MNAIMNTFDSGDGDVVGAADSCDVVVDDTSVECAVCECHVTQLQRPRDRVVQDGVVLVPSNERRGGGARVAGKTRRFTNC